MRPRRHWLRRSLPVGQPVPLAVLVGGMLSRSARPPPRPRRGDASSDHGSRRRASAARRPCRVLAGIVALIAASRSLSGRSCLAGTAAVAGHQARCVGYRRGDGSLARRGWRRTGEGPWLLLDRLAAVGEVLVLADLGLATSFFSIVLATAGLTSRCLARLAGVAGLEPRTNPRAESMCGAVGSSLAAFRAPVPGDAAGGGGPCDRRLNTSGIAGSSGSAAEIFPDRGPRRKICRGRLFSAMSWALDFADGSFGRLADDHPTCCWLELLRAA